MNATSKPTPLAPGWMRYTLVAAAIYNLAWGTWVILRPNDLFNLTAIPQPIYPGIWQCVGMIVGVYGIGYYFAAADPYRHWPIVLVGFLGKILGPIGFLQTLLTIGPGERGYLPPAWGATILTNDLIWWIPFAVILYEAFKHNVAPESSETTISVDAANQQFTTSRGDTIAAASRDQPLLLLFTRHAGCTFCREALVDLADRLPRLRSAGVEPMVVFQGSDAIKQTLAGYGLGDVATIHDPNCELYRAYDLGRGRVGQLFGPAVWVRGFRAAILDRHGVGKLDGDGFQMPGAFLVRDGKVIAGHRHRDAADRVDVCELVDRADHGQSSALESAV